MWLKNTIIDGFARLITLRLQNCPPQDAIEVTVHVWLETLRHYFSDLDESQDRWRIEKAFLKLCAECDRFPSPKMLIDRMPPREIIVLESPEMTEEQRLKQLANAQRLKDMIKKCLEKTAVKH